MAQVIGVAIELGGMPVPRGGGVKLVDALAGIVRDAGGACETGREVERILVSGGRATGVRTADGEEIEAARAVLANVTPQQLYGDLLGAGGRAARRRDGSASAAARCRSTSRCRSRSTGRVTSVSAARRSST